MPASADRLEPVRVRRKGWVVSKLHGDDRYLDLGRQVHAICEAQQVVHQRRERVVDRRNDGQPWPSG